MAVSPRGVADAASRPCRYRLVWGRVDHADPRGGDFVGDRLLELSRLHAEADAVAGRDAVREPAGRHATGQVPEPEHREIEGLVGVEVDHVAAAGRQLQEHLVGLDGIVVEVRAAADDVGSGGQGVAGEGPVVGARPPGDGPADQGHDLQVDQVAEAPPGLDQPLHRPQAVTGDDVGVRPDGGRAVGHHQPRRPLRPVRDVLGGQAGAVGVHRLDGAQEVALRVEDAFGQEGLVEVGVGLDGRGEDHVAVEVEHGVLRCGGEVGTDSGDDARGDGDVRRAAVGQPDPPEDEAARSRHGRQTRAGRSGSGRRSTGSPRRGKTSSTIRCICSSMSSVRRPG